MFIFTARFKSTLLKGIQVVSLHQLAGPANEGHFPKAANLHAIV